MSLVYVACQLISCFEFAHATYETLVLKVKCKQQVQVFLLNLVAVELDFTSWDNPTIGGRMQIVCLAILVPFLTSKWFKLWDHRAVCPLKIKAGETQF